MTPGRLLGIAEQHPPELDITDLAKAIARKARAALLDKATPGHHPLSTAESAAHHMANAKDEIVRALPALLAYVRELERERDDAMYDVGQAADKAALAMRERCAKACDDLRTDDLIVSAWEAGRQAAIAECAAAIRALEP